MIPLRRTMIDVRLGRWTIASEVSPMAFRLKPGTVAKVCFVKPKSKILGYVRAHPVV